MDIANDEIIRKRFFKKVRKTNDCWIWIGAHTPRGYGQMCVNYRNIRATRISLLLHGITVDKDRIVCHRCDTPSCVRPDHLFVGTASDNMRDMVAKGRMPMHLRKGNTLYRGEKNPSARLTAEQVKEIRDRYANQDISQDALAKRYGVSPNCISRVIQRTTWTHI